MASGEWRVASAEGDLLPATRYPPPATCCAQAIILPCPLPPCPPAPLRGGQPLTLLVK
ncbi:protein of unknown function [Candidatus Promineifilum breve]|uniref:Uncharacterized protein n=1 Tax=Candidatus Promineifilum breve TaxID=1806508 RepID=A0A160T339_9CHLR|nr:protein of unknown function [Candidatus Promineifilum breve]